jgi:hypothetical protein
MNPYSSLGVKEKAPYLYQTTGRIIKYIYTVYTEYWMATTAMKSTLGTT